MFTSFHGHVVTLVEKKMLQCVMKSQICIIFILLETSTVIG